MALIEVDTKRYDTSMDGWYNSIAKLTDDRYIIPYRGAANDSFVQAIRTYIDMVGRLGDYEFSDLTYYGGRLITVSGSVRALCWRGTDQIRLLTLTITDAGVITPAVLSSVVIDGGICGSFPEIIHRAATVYLLYHNRAGSGGIFRTRNIANDGTIGAAIDTWAFGPVPTFTPGMSNLLPIDGNIYACVYYDDATDTTRVLTINVTAAGNIVPHAFVSTLIIENGRRTGHHYITPIVGGTKYAIVWADSEDYPSNRIMLATVDITNLGIITPAGGSVNLETRNYNRDPSVNFYDTGQYLVVYSGYDLIGKRIAIAVDGTIGSVLETKELSGLSGDYPSVVNRTGKQFIIAHGTTDYGWATWVGLAPVITTQAMSDLALTTATGHGNVTALGEPDADQHGHCWDTSPNPTISDSKTELGPVAATGAFTSPLTELTPGTTYYIRAYVRTGDHTGYGNQVTFTTPAAPTVTTDPATARGAIAATVNGTLNQDGGEACECGFTYHFRAFATNSVGTDHGDDRTFATALVISKAYALARREL